MVTTTAPPNQQLPELNIEIDKVLPDWALPLIEENYRNKVLYGGRGGGKDLVKDTPIPTPDGWKEIGDLEVGDQVFDSSGKPCKVTGVFPQGIKRMYRVDFDHGERIYAGAEHLWVTTDYMWRKRRNRQGMTYEGWDVYNSPLTTLEIKETLTYGKRDNLNHSIPLTPSIEMPNADLPIPPYILGLWLGDGDSRSGMITALSEDAEHYRARLAKLGEELHDATPSSNYRNAPNFRIEGLRTRLRELNLIQNKHIPQQYLRASTDQRMELLRGLMDTDGYIDSRGHAEFCNTNTTIAYNVEELLNSLGFRTNMRTKVAKLYGEEKGIAHMVVFLPEEDVVTLPRKLARIKPKISQRNSTKQRMITNIVTTNLYAESVCISVDSPLETFLAGRSFIPTHNSVNVARALVILACSKPLRIACTREFQSSIRESTKLVIEEAIADLGVQWFFNIERSIITGLNGSYFFFHGIEGSREAMRSWQSVDICWIEEAQRLTINSYKLLRPTIRGTGSELWFTFNPRYRTDPVYASFVERTPPNSYILQVNYDKNPWFPDVLEEERKYSEQTDPNGYRHTWEGEPDDTTAVSKVINYEDLEKCIDAHKKLGIDLGSNERWKKHAGLDVADAGSDGNALVLRNGPFIVDVHTWRAKTLGVTTRNADNICRDRRVRRMYFDGTGIGAGVRSHIREIHDRNYGAYPINFGSAPAGGERFFGFRTKNKDYFYRRNAQMAWNLRLRIQQTGRLLLGEDVNPDDCLFIPGDLPRLADLKTHFLRPEWKENGSGQIVIDKDPEGIGSPDIFDAACLAYVFDSRYGLKLPRGMSRIHNTTDIDDSASVMDLDFQA